MRFRGAIVLVCAWLSAASAETPQQQADRLFAEGRDLLTVQNDSKAACEKFEEAIKLDPTATGTMLNLGLCYENLGKYATSIRWFRKAQAAAAENKLTDYENAAKEHTVTISPKVPTLNIEVSGPPNVEILVDGTRVEATEFGRVEVDPGSHELVGRAPGMKRVVQTVDVAEAENKSVQIVVNEAAVPVYVDRGTKRRKIAYGLAAGGLVVLGASWLYNEVQQGKQEDIRREVAGNPPDVPPQPFDMARQEAFDDAAQNMKIWGTTLFVTGTALVFAGAIIYFTAPNKEMISDGTAVRPVLGRDQLGFAVSGSF